MTIADFGALVLKLGVSVDMEIESGCAYGHYREKLGYCSGSGHGQQKAQPFRLGVSLARMPKVPTAGLKCYCELMPLFALELSTARNTKVSKLCMIPSL